MVHCLPWYHAPSDKFEHPEWDLGLFLIDKLLQKQKKLATQFGLSQYQHSWAAKDRNYLIANKLNYDISVQALLQDQRYGQLNTNQKQCFDNIVAAVTNDPQNAQFFLQGASGTGKTFLYKVLCNYFQAQGKIILYVALSGIAVELLLDG